MADPVLGGVGLGLVWGWWVAMAAWAVRPRLLRALPGLGIASLVLAVGIYVLAGLPAVVGLGIAAAVAVFVGYGVRLELGRPLEPGG